MSTFDRTAPHVWEPDWVHYVGRGFVEECLTCGDHQIPRDQHPLPGEALAWHTEGDLSDQAFQLQQSRLR